jgi:hypothetical protein
MSTSGLRGRVVFSATHRQASLEVRPVVGDVEAKSRLASVLDVCAQERKALDALDEPRLAGVLQAMTTLRTEIVAALASLEQLSLDGGRDIEA